MLRNRKENSLKRLRFFLFDSQCGDTTRSSLAWWRVRSSLISNLQNQCSFLSISHPLSNTHIAWSIILSFSSATTPPPPHTHTHTHTHARTHTHTKKKQKKTQTLQWSFTLAIVWALGTTSIIPIRRPVAMQPYGTRKRSSPPPCHSWKTRQTDRGIFVLKSFRIYTLY